MTTETLKVLKNIRDDNNQNKFSIEYLKSAGSININSDFSGNLTGYTYTNNTGNTVKIKCIILYLEDSGATFLSSNFAQSAPLNVGLKLYINDGIKQLLHSDKSIKTNSDLLQLFKVISYDQFSTGNVLCVWNLSNPLILANTDKFGIDAADDLSGIEIMNVSIETYEITE